MENLEYKSIETKLDRLYSFIEMMLSWNKKFNLTSITDQDEIFVKHILDSIAVCNYINFKDKEVIDVGTGGGFPGLAIYIVNPVFKLTLLDSKRKKCNFLKLVKHELSLQNVSVVNQRAEEIGQDELYRENYDLCLSRAVSDISVLLELSLPLLKNNGLLISWESNRNPDGPENIYTEKKHNNINALNILNGEFLKNEYYGKWLREYMLIEDLGDRFYSIFEKKSTTPKKYPRKPGIPTKRPL